MADYQGAVTDTFNVADGFSCDIVAFCPVVFSSITCASFYEVVPCLYVSSSFSFAPSVYSSFNFFGGTRTSFGLVDKTFPYFLEVSLSDKLLFFGYPSIFRQLVGSLYSSISFSSQSLLFQCFKLLSSFSFSDYSTLFLASAIKSGFSFSDALFFPSHITTLIDTLFYGGFVYHPQLDVTLKSSFSFKSFQELLIQTIQRLLYFRYLNGRISMYELPEITGIDQIITTKDGVYTFDDEQNISGEVIFNLSSLDLSRIKRIDKILSNNALNAATIYADNQSYDFRSNLEWINPARGICGKDLKVALHALSKPLEFAQFRVYIGKRGKK